MLEYVGLENRVVASEIMGSYFWMVTQGKSGNLELPKYGYTVESLPFRHLYM